MARVRERRTWVSAVVICAALAVPAAMALADENLGSAGGITYVGDSLSPSPPTLAVVEAACPGGTQVSGGGFDSDVGGSLNDAAPADGPDGDGELDDAWFASVYYGPTGYDPTLRVFAICEEGPHQRPTATTEVAAGGGGAVSVECPGRRKPTGGGAQLSGAGAEAYVHSSHPFDGSDGNDEPDDGWRARAYNDTGVAKTLTVTAICRRGEFRNRYRHHDAPTPAYTFSPCVGSEHLVGLGWRLTGPASQAMAERVVPSDDGDPGSVPDDGGEFLGDDNGGGPERLYPHAICSAG